MTPVILIVAGIDPSGGAGLVADVATATARGCHAAALPTALTLQDSAGCRAVTPLEVAWIAAQLDLLVEDLPIRAVKIGMLASARVAEAVAAGLAPLVARGVPVVLDPVLRATIGVALLDGDALQGLAAILRLASLVTPNADEAERLTAIRVDGQRGQIAAAARLRALGAAAVLVKGGHVAGDPVRDLLDDGGQPLWLSAPRRPGVTPHGTGCALSTEIACALAHGRSLREAVEDGHARTRARIAAAQQLGKGRPFLAPPVEE